MLSLRRFAPHLQILVYVDGATDNTAEILRGFGDSITVVVSPRRYGKTYGMNSLIAMSDADFVIFTDANVIYAEDVVPHLLQPFRDPAVGCTLGHLIYFHKVRRSATATTGSLYWRMEERIKEVESQTGSAISSDGAIFAIRRSLYEAPPPEVSDDIFVSLAILCRGYRVVRAAKAIAYEEITTIPREEFRRKIRIACNAFAVHCILWPRLRSLPPADLYKYISHKLLRWLTFYLQVIGGALIVIGIGLAVGWKAAALVVAGTVLAGTLLWNCQSGHLGLLGSILQAFVATALGVWMAVGGRRFQVWTPPASARNSI